MKNIIFILIVFILLSSAVKAQDKVIASDSILSGKDSITYFIKPSHNYNIITIKSLVTTDTIKVYNTNEDGDRIPVALRDLNSNTDMEGNSIRGLSGTHEFLVLNPNLYLLTVRWGRVSSLSKTIKLGRRGSTLK